MSNQTHKVEYINNTQNGLNTYNEDRTLNSCVNTELENNSVCRLGFNPTT